jgi:hypothetical protein
MGEKGRTMKQSRLMWMTGAVVAASAAIVGVTAATAGPPAGTVPPHRHFVVTESGDLRPVGPNACEDGSSTQFDNFHFNIHRGKPFDNGIISADAC